MRTLIKKQVDAKVHIPRNNNSIYKSTVVSLLNENPNISHDRFVLIDLFDFVVICYPQVQQTTSEYIYVIEYINNNLPFLFIRISATAEQTRSSFLACVNMEVNRILKKL